MTSAEAKSILLLYRPNAVDTNDPQMAEALALTRQDTELGAWFQAHCARQQALQEKFRQIAIPAGLKEQIISEHNALLKSRQTSQRRLMALVTVCLLLFAGLGIWHWRPAPADNTLTIYKHEMMGLALRGYGMDLATNDLAQIRTYLTQHEAPANFKLSRTLQQATINGCAVETWQNAKVSMVCFHTPTSGDKNNLWLFVVDQSAIEKSKLTSTPTLETVHQLTTAAWVENGKLYLLGSEGTEQDIQKYL